MLKNNGTPRKKAVIEKKLLLFTLKNNINML